MPDLRYAVKTVATNATALAASSNLPTDSAARFVCLQIVVFCMPECDGRADLTATYELQGSMHSTVHNDVAQLVNALRYRHYTAQLSSSNHNVVATLSSASSGSGCRSMPDAVNKGFEPRLIATRE